MGLDIQGVFSHEIGSFDAGWRDKGILLRSITKWRYNRRIDAHLERTASTVNVQSSKQLAAKKCVPCEGGVPKYVRDQALAQLESLDGWELVDMGQRIRKRWKVKDFLAGIAFFEQVAKVAEKEGHHPDIHLGSYRNLWIDLWTHAIGGLSENDFILAAKINQLPIELQEG